MPHGLWSGSGWTDETYDLSIKRTSAKCEYSCRGTGKYSGLVGYQIVTNNLVSFTYEKYNIQHISMFAVCLWSLRQITDDTSKVTYFVTLEREGDEKIVLEKGQPFVEPGYYAEMNGEDITESVQIKGSVDVNTPGIYNLVYAAYNEDGFAKTFTRTVYVADNTASPLKSGIYTVAEGSKRTAPSVVAFSGNAIVIFQMEPGIFYISDFLRRLV